MFKNMFRKQFTEVEDAWALAHAIVDTVRAGSGNLHRAISGVSA